MITFLKTLLQEMRFGCTGTMSKRKSNHHSGCQKRRRDPKNHVKVMRAAFFDSEDVVHYEFLPQGRTVNKEYYLEVMQRLYESVRKKRRDAWQENRLCSNMTTRPHIHRSLAVTSWTNTRRLAFHSLRTIQILHQLTFFCFQSSNQRRKAAVLSLLRQSRQICAAFLKKTFQECFRTLKKRWQRCIKSTGEYFEGNKAE